jgi:plastocyanin
MPKNSYRTRLHPPTWTYLSIIVLGALVLLAACGNGNTTSAVSTTAPTTIASTPTANTSSPTPIPPTPTQIPKPTPASGSIQTVMIITNSDGSFSFSPTTLAVKPGTTVIWKNVSSAPHTVTSDDGKTFDSGTVAVGGTFRFKFTTAGTFPYHCNYHPYMRSTIDV